MDSDTREILDAVKSKISLREDLHYLFDPKGELLTSYWLAAKAFPDEEHGILEELIDCVRNLFRRFKFTRIADAIDILKSAGKFGKDVDYAFSLIAFELLVQEELSRTRRRRVKGRSIFAGHIVIDGVFIPKSSEKIKIDGLKGEEVYNFTANHSWVMVDRVLWAVRNGKTGYDIKMTAKELNAIQDDALRFLNRYLHFAELPVDQRPSNRKTHSDYARFCYEKLKSYRK